VLALVEELLHLVAFDTERLGGRVEVETVTGLILNLGHEDGLAMQRWCPGDPVPFGLHTDHLGVCMLGDLTDQQFPVTLRHPVTGLDLLFGVNDRLKPGFRRDGFAGHSAL